MYVTNVRNKVYQLLRWSEGYTKTDMVYLTKGGGWLFISQAISLIAGFLLAVAFANLIDQTTYGTYKFVISLASLIGLASLSGLHTSIVQAVARGHEGSFKQGFNTYLRWGAIMSGIALVGSLYYLINENLILSVSLLIVALFVPIRHASSLFSAYLQGKKDFKTSSLYNMLLVVLPALFSFLTLLITDSLLVIILVHFAGSALVALALYERTFKKVAPENNSIETSTISYSKHLSVISGVTSAMNHFDKVLLFHYLGAIEVAVYSFAVSLPMQIRGALRNLGPLSLPKFAENSVEHVKLGLPRKLWQILLLSALITLVYILAAPVIYNVFFPQYLDSILYSQLFAPIIILATIGLLPNNFLMAKQKTKALYISNTLSAVLGIVLLIIMTPLWGITGAIAARLITKAASSGLSILLAFQVN